MCIIEWSTMGTLTHYNNTKMMVGVNPFHNK